MLVEHACDHAGVREMNCLVNSAHVLGSDDVVEVSVVVDVDDGVVVVGTVDDSVVVAETRHAKILHSRAMRNNTPPQIALHAHVEGSVVVDVEVVSVVVDVDVGVVVVDSVVVAKRRMLV